MHEAMCVCAHIPQLDLATRIVLVAHTRELKKTTTTGPLALHALGNHELHVHGLPDTRVDLSHLHQEDRRVWLLFPSDKAEPITPELVAADARPVTLVVPEGTWAHARRMVRRLPGLSPARHVVLPPGPPTAWTLRREPTPGGLATLEAIARAVGIIESPSAQRALEDLLARVVEGTLRTRRTPAKSMSDQPSDKASSSSQRA